MMDKETDCKSMQYLLYFQYVKIIYRNIQI